MIAIMILSVVFAFVFCLASFSGFGRKSDEEIEKVFKKEIENNSGKKS